MSYISLVLENILWYRADKLYIVSILTIDLTVYINLGVHAFHASNCVSYRYSPASICVSGTHGLFDEDRTALVPDK